MIKAAGGERNYIFHTALLMYYILSCLYTISYDITRNVIQSSSTRKRISLHRHLWKQNTLKVSERRFYFNATCSSHKLVWVCQLINVILYLYFFFETTKHTRELVANLVTIDPFFNPAVLHVFINVCSQQDRDATRKTLGKWDISNRKKQTSLAKAWMIT